MESKLQVVILTRKRHSQPEQCVLTKEGAEQARREGAQIHKISDYDPLIAALPPRVQAAVRKFGLASFESGGHFGCDCKHSDSGGGQ